VTVVSAPGGRSDASTRHGTRVAATAGATLALQATRLLQGADQADVTDGEDDEWYEQSQQRPDETVDELETRPFTKHSADRLRTSTQTLQPNVETRGPHG